MATVRSQPVGHPFRLLEQLRLAPLLRDRVEVWREVPAELPAAVLYVISAPEGEDVEEDSGVEPSTPQRPHVKGKGVDDVGRRRLGEKVLRPGFQPRAGESPPSRGVERREVEGGEKSRSNPRPLEECSRLPYHLAPPRVVVDILRAVVLRVGVTPDKHQRVQPQGEGGEDSRPYRRPVRVSRGYDRDGFDSHLIMHHRSRVNRPQLQPRKVFHVSDEYRICEVLYLLYSLQKVARLLAQPDQRLPIPLCGEVWGEDLHDSKEVPPLKFLPKLQSPYHLCL